MPRLVIAAPELVAKIAERPHTRHDAIGKNFSGKVTVARDGQAIAL